MDPISPVKRIKRKNKKGAEVTYVCKYKNKWAGNRSYCAEQICIGKLEPDGQTVIFGQKFLSQHPEIKAPKAFLIDGQVVFEEPETFAEEKLKQERERLASLYRDTQVYGAGATYLFEGLAKQSKLATRLSKVFGHEANKILSLAIYYAVTPDARAYKFEEFALHHRIPSGPLSASEITHLFQSITLDAIREYLGLALQDATAAESNHYWAYDTTSISSYSHSTTIAKYGHNKENDDLAQINLAMVVDQTTGEPVYYKVLDGSTPDVVTLKNLFLDLQELKALDLSLVMDRGFISYQNLDLLLSQNVKFIQASIDNLAATRSAIDQERKALRNCPADDYSVPFDCFCKTRRIEWTVHYKGHPPLKTPLYFHVFLDKNKECNEIEGAANFVQEIKEKLEKNLRVKETTLCRFFSRKDKGPWEFDQGKWNRMVQDAGFWVLISNCESDGFRALQAYKYREVIEKAFNEYKDRCCGRRTRTMERALQGKIFVLYLALALNLILKHRILKNRVPAYESIELAIDDLDEIKVFKRNPPKEEGEEAPEEQAFYWGEFPKKAREFYEQAGISLPPKMFVI